MTCSCRPSMRSGPVRARRSISGAAPGSRRWRSCGAGGGCSRSTPSRRGSSGCWCARLRRSESGCRRRWARSKTSSYRPPTSCGPGTACSSSRRSGSRRPGRGSGRAFDPAGGSRASCSASATTWAAGGDVNAHTSRRRRGVLRRLGARTVRRRGERRGRLLGAETLAPVPRRRPGARCARAGPLDSRDASFEQRVAGSDRPAHPPSVVPPGGHPDTAREGGREPVRGRRDARRGDGDRARAARRRHRRDAGLPRRARRDPGAGAGRSRGLPPGRSARSRTRGTWTPRSP